MIFIISYFVPIPKVQLQSDGCFPLPALGVPLRAGGAGERERGEIGHVREALGSHRWYAFFLTMWAADDLRKVVMSQEIELGQLRETLKKRKSVLNSCRTNRRKEKRFLVSVISQCREDGFDLTEETCHSLCQEKKVKEEECSSFCKTRSFPSVHWHKDDANSSFLEIAQLKTNQTRRRRDLKSETLPLNSIKDPGETHREGQSLVQQMESLRECANITCLSNAAVFTCLNRDQSLEPSISNLIGTSRRKPLKPSGWILSILSTG